MVLIPVERLRAICDPFESCPWDGESVSLRDVTQALEEGRLEGEYGGFDHAGRIAYFVLNPCKDLIEVDVGVPVLGYRPAWMVLDGNHRLAAAIYAGRAEIAATIAGQLDYAENLFGVNCGSEGADLGDVASVGRCGG